MAEFVMKYLLEASFLDGKIRVDSKATSTEEIGNPPHYGTVRKLESVGIPVLPHAASQMTKKDYSQYEYIIGMDSYNIRNILRITGGDPEHKVSRLLDFTGESRDIDDPWYTGDFDSTYEDVRRGCEALLNKLEKEFTK